MKAIIYNTIIAGFIVLTSCGGNKNSTSPIKKDLVQAVYASGKVYPHAYYKLLEKSW